MTIITVPALNPIEYQVLENLGREKIRLSASIQHEH